VWQRTQAVSHDDVIRRRFEASIAAKRAVLDAPEHVATIGAIADALVESYRAGGKAVFCGNGGSAADATHLAAELVGRFVLERPPLPALSLSDNGSSVTAIGNDYAYDQVFARQLRGLGREGDVLVALSTSGGSANVLEAVEAARELGITTVAMTGQKGTGLAGACDLALVVPSSETARVQEVTMLAAHTVCELVESALFA